jgi:tRNA A37 threonylcarbamoyltransferase TsaD
MRILAIETSCDETSVALLSFATKHEMLRDIQ